MEIADHHKFSDFTAEIHGVIKNVFVLNNMLHTKFFRVQKRSIAPAVSIPHTLLSSGYSGALVHIRVRVREFHECEREKFRAFGARRKEISDAEVYELRNITVIHCISERPVTTFIQGRQVYTRTQSAQVRTPERRSGRFQQDLQGSIFQDPERRELALSPVADNFLNSL
ncbi:hypothetical protein TcasGA2_TC014738 [Tribolium castaneum]|uniref:Uncharacterized protein n=1 Tax=Tribolium castaneum TaxID=7070 RepID=D6WJ82_TRICA|nr:hypothetical protein TcasGA2_TC014738 [Tribolium castaneum]